MSVHTTTISDDMRVVVSNDEGTDDPRSWTPECDVLQYNVPFLSRADSLGDCATKLGCVFTIVYGNTGDDAKALLVAQRFKRFFDVKEEIDTSTIMGYSQGDWADTVAVVPEGYGTPAGHLSTFRKWKFGDVYVVTVERLVSYARLDADGNVDPAFEHENHTEWESIESCGGVYFDDDFPDDDSVIAYVKEQGWL